MPSLARAALALALCLGAAAKKTRSPYFYNIYAQVFLRSVRKISAQDSSFIVEGQISYAYRQDGLFYFFNDNDDFPGTATTAMAIEPTADGCMQAAGVTCGCNINDPNNVPLGCLIDSTRNAANWLGVGYKLKLAPVFPSQTSSLYSAISWTVSYGVPSFTGLNDTSLYPPAAGLSTNDWIYKGMPNNLPSNLNKASTIIGACKLAAAVTASTRLTCSSVTFTDGNGNTLTGHELLPQMSCSTAGDVGRNPSGAGAILQNGSGLVWDFTEKQTLTGAVGSTVTCSLYGVPPVQVWVVGTQRFGGTFLQPQLLQDFPFDTQSAGIAIEASAGTTMYTAADVTFVVPSGASATLIPSAGVDGWNTKGSSAVATSRFDKNLGATFAQAVRAARGGARAL